MIPHPIGFMVPSGTSSAFDEAISDLSPDVWYKFEDASFATTIVDSGSLGADLTSQNTTDASVGAALRTTKLQSLSMPSFATWTTGAAYYTDSSNAIADLLGGEDELSIIMSINLASGQQSGGRLQIATLSQHETQSTDELFTIEVSTGEYIFFHENKNTSRESEQSSSAINDATTRLYIWRIPATGTRYLEENGSVSDSGSVIIGTYDQVTQPFSIGGKNQASNLSGLAFKSDIFAIWKRRLSDAEISDLWTLYNSEL